MQPRRRFRFLKELSEGAFGKVYLAEMVTGEGFSSVVAIKLLHGKWVGHTEIVQRSRDEARVLGLLHHRNIIRVEDLTSINGQCAIVMEYLDGVDLKNLVSFCRDNESMIPRKVAFEVMAQAASALHAAYSSQPLQGGKALEVIHRDIKPSNVMLTTAGDVKVLDFGTAQAQFDEREAHTQALAFGSAAYMAPERLLGDPDTPFGDVFSLGVTLYELLTQQGYGKINIRPEKFEKRLSANLEGMDLSDLSEERQAQVIAMMRLLLAYEPEDRPTAGQVVELLEALAEEIHDGSLRRFCREVVGPCRATLEPAQNPDDPLTGSTLFEDTGTMMRALEQGAGPETWLEDENNLASDSGEHANGAAEASRSGARSNPRSGGGESDPPAFSLPSSGLAAAISGGGPGAQDAPSIPPGLAHSAAVQVGGGQAPSLLPEEPSAEIEEVEESAPAESISEQLTERDNGGFGVGAEDETSEQFDEDEVSPTFQGPAVASEPVASAGRKVEAVAGVGAASTARSSEPVDDSDEGGGGGMIKFLLIAVVLLVLGGGGVAAVVAGGLLSTTAGSGDKDTETQDPQPDGPGPDAGPKASADALAGGTHELGSGDATIVLSLSESGKGVVGLKGPQSKLEWDGTGELELTAAEAGLWRGKVETASGSQRATFEVSAGQRCSFSYDIAAMPDAWEAKGCE